MDATSTVGPTLVSGWMPAPTDAWAVEGIRTVTQWVTWQLGVNTAEEHRLIELAQARRSHPAVSALFDAGRLSLTQATLASRVAAHRDEEIADMVTMLTVPQLQTYVRAMRNSDRDPTPDGSSPPSAPVPERDESVRFTRDDTGWLCGRFELDPEHGHQFEAALTHARDLLHHHADPPPSEVTDEPAPAATAPSTPTPAPAAAPGRIGWVDALVLLGSRSLDSDPSPSRRDRFRINVHLHPDRDQRLVWADWGGLPDWLTSRLLCDGTINPIYTKGATPVSVGRTHRIVPDRTRRLVTHRDHHHCRVPWCTNHRWLDVHHLVHWADGGPTDTPNLMLICPTCHHDLHRHHFDITGNADDPTGLVFTDRHGHPIDYLPRPVPPDRPPPAPTHAYEHPYGERIDRADIWIDPPPWRQPHRRPAA